MCVISKLNKLSVVFGLRPRSVSSIRNLIISDTGSFGIVDQP